MFTNRKADKAATQVVATDAQGAGDAERIGTFRKSLVDKEYLQPLVSIQSEAQKLYRTYCRSWQHGVRICPVTMLDELLQNLSELKVRFESEVQTLVQSWPEAVEAAEKELGKYFDEDQYPHPSDVARAYSFDYTVEPLPDPATLDDIRIIVGRARVEELKKAQQKDMQERWVGVTQECTELLSKAVGNLRDQLSKEKGRTFQSLTGNIKELVDILPAMNLDGDPRIDALIAEAREKLLVHDTETLRNDPEARKSTREAAEALMDKIGAF